MVTITIVYVFSGGIITKIINVLLREPPDFLIKKGNTGAYNAFVWL